MPSIRVAHHVNSRDYAWITMRNAHGNVHGAAGKAGRRRRLLSAIIGLCVEIRHVERRFFLYLQKRFMWKKTHLDTLTHSPQTFFLAHAEEFQTALAYFSEQTASEQNEQPRGLQQ